MSKLQYNAGTLALSNGETCEPQADASGNQKVALAAGTTEIGRINQIMFNVAGSAVARPANTTPYAANDAISNDPTAGNVVAGVVTVADANDAPVMIEEVRVASTDTGPGTASARIRMWVYNTDPALSTGIAAGDNVTFSVKQAGFIGTFVGTCLPCADGSVAVLVPESDGAAGGGVRICNPESGGKRLWYLYQTLTIFSPSANSTTFTPRFKGWQGRLAA